MYRKAVFEDCKEVYALICDMEQASLSFDKFSEIFQEQTGDSRYYCLVCERGGVISGVLNLRFEKQLHHTERVAEIMEFAVDSSCRNRGLGKEMLARACEIAKDCGCVQIEVACNQLRIDTHRFYQREGMHNFHFKFSKSLTGQDSVENAIGR